jgi:hypothetical protein
MAHARHTKNRRWRRSALGVRPRRILSPQTQDDNSESFSHRQLLRELRSLSVPSGRPTPARIEVVESLRERGLLREADADRWLDSGHVGDAAWDLFSKLDHTYPEGTLGVTWDVDRPHSYLRATLTATAVAAALGSAALTYLDLTDTEVQGWLARHNWTNQLIGSLVIVLATYVIVDRILDQRRSGRWIAVSERPIFHYVQQLAAVRENVYHVGQISLLLTSIDPPEESVRIQLEQELEEERAELRLRLPILNDSRDNLDVFFGAAPELASLLPTQFTLDRYVSEVQHSLANSEQLELDLPEVEGFFDGWPAFRDAFNLHILAVYQLFGPSELDELFEQPRHPESEYNRRESRNRAGHSEGSGVRPDEEASDIPF